MSQTPITAAGFTSEILSWSPWIIPVDLTEATPDQLAVLDETGPVARKSQYYLSLLHQAQILRHRSATYNEIMYAPEGLNHVERELAAVVASRTTGCEYCVSVHARRFLQLKGDPALLERVFIDPTTAATTPREKALIEASLVLTQAPQDLGPDHISALKASGMAKIEILDLIHCVAIFAWANRLMLNLGSPT